jgi:prevent-host-death family protein
MTIHVNIGEAKTNLSRLIQASLNGEEVFIDKAGEPLVRLVPARDLPSPGAQRSAAFGSMKDMIPDLDWEAPAFTDEELARMMDEDDGLST